MSAERRQNQRRRTLMGAKIRCAVFTGATPCVVRNVSDTGACLSVEDALWVPGHFQIEVPHLRLRSDARVVWRRGNGVGIAFEKTKPAFLGQSFSPQREPAANPMDRILYLEQERAKLALRVKQLTDEL
ncbi:MAG: PilZ domain-containing protein [Proteobacteria bacterium]|nr:PilZ domain-containing protein [Pseudomonadota bacterium]